MSSAFTSHVRFRARWCESEKTLTPVLRPGAGERRTKPAHQAKSVVFTGRYSVLVSASGVPGRDACAGAEAELGEDVRDMVLNGAF
jgi:hypothetical protein